MVFYSNKYATYSTSLNAANRLYQKLFQKRLYFKDVAPINGLATENSTAEQRLPVTIKLQLIAVINLDAAREILQAYLELVRRDLRLGLTSSEFDGLTQLWIQCDSLWVPDDFVVNM